MSIENKLIFSDIGVYLLTKALEVSVNLCDFKCEKQEFNDYLYNTAYKDHISNLGKVWLFTTHEKKPIGFVTLAMSQLSRSFDRYFSSMTAHTNVPALLIGEMTRHVDYKRLGHKELEY